MGDLPGELGAVPLVDQPQVRSGVAAPCRRLGFTIALRFVSFKCCLSLSWFRNFQSELDKIVLAVVFYHLQKVTHGFCVPVGCLCRPLHYHYLPWQVPGNCILVMVVYVHMPGEFEGVEGFT